MPQLHLAPQEAGDPSGKNWTRPAVVISTMNRNALARKGKAEGTEEGDMDMVVSIHNNMNERTWKKILEWEKLRR